MLLLKQDIYLNKKYNHSETVRRINDPDDKIEPVFLLKPNIAMQLDSGSFIDVHLTSTSNVLSIDYNRNCIILLQNVHGVIQTIIRNFVFSYLETGFNSLNCIYNFFVVFLYTQMITQALHNILTIKGNV